MSERLNFDSSFDATVKQFRTEAQDGDYLIISYTDKSTVTVSTQGSGGVDSLAQHLPNDDVRYGYVKRFHKVEMVNAVKYAFIDWTPDRIPPMRKALISQHKAQISKALEPHSVTVQASQLSEVSDAIVLEKIAQTSGTAINVTNKVASKPVPVDSLSATAVKAQDLVPASITADRTLSIVNEQELREAIKDVRNDQTETNWALASYADIKTIQFVGKGTGGIPELISNLDNQRVFYAFYRVTAQYDKTTAVKFGFLKLTSPTLPIMHKAQLSTHQGFVQKIFEPYHFSFDVLSISDFTEDAIQEKILQDTGKKSNVVGSDSLAAEVARQKAREHVVPDAHVPTAAIGSVAFSSPDEFKSALASVRQSSSPITWIVTSYVKDTIHVLGTGQGGYESMISAFDANNVNFALLKVVDQIDNSATIKFVYVRYIPDTLPPMQKAKMSTKKGMLDAVFTPFHADFTISSVHELSQDQVMDRVQSASGSKSKEVAKGSAEVATRFK